jgi:hypothetical protein
LCITLNWLVGYLLAQIAPAPEQTATNLPGGVVLQLLVGVGEGLVDGPVLPVLHVLEIALRVERKSSHEFTSIPVDSVPSASSTEEATENL